MNGAGYFVHGLAGKAANEGIAPRAILPEDGQVSACLMKTERLALIFGAMGCQQADPVALGIFIHEEG